MLTLLKDQHGKHGPNSTRTLAYYIPRVSETGGIPRAGGTYDGNERWKHCVVPHARTLCVPMFLFTYFHRAGSKGAFGLPGATWDHFRCAVEPSPGHILCRTPKEGERYDARCLLCAERAERPRTFTRVRLHLPLLAIGKPLKASLL